MLLLDIMNRLYRKSNDIKGSAEKIYETPTRTAKFE